MCAPISMTLQAGVCIWQCACVCFVIFFYCLFVCACSGTLYSAVVLLVSIKFRFFLGYSSVWYETQRQDTVSVGKPIKKERKKKPLHLEAQKQTGFTKKTKPQTTICPENYIFGKYFVFLGTNSKSISPLVDTHLQKNKIIDASMLI